MQDIRSVYVTVGSLSMLLACPTVPANPISIHYVLPKRPPDLRQPLLLMLLPIRGGI